MSPMPPPTLPPRGLAHTVPPPIQTRDASPRPCPHVQRRGGEDDFLDDRYLIPSAPVGRPGIVTPFNERGQPRTPVIPAAPVFNPANPITPQEVLELTTAEGETTDAVLADILTTPSLSTTTTSTLGVTFWSEFLSYASSTSSTTTSASPHEDVDYDGEEVHVAVEEPDVDDVHVEVEDEETAEAMRDEGSPVGTFRASEAEMSDGVDHGAGIGEFPDFPLSPREERLAQHTARLVVAEVYHLLRTNGVIPGPGSFGGMDVRAVPRTPRATPPWRRTARLPRPRSASAPGPYTTTSDPRFLRTRGLSTSLPTTFTTTTWVSSTVCTTPSLVMSTAGTLTLPSMWPPSLTSSSSSAWPWGVWSSSGTVMAAPTLPWDGTLFGLVVVVSLVGTVMYVVLVSIVGVEMLC